MFTVSSFKERHVSKIKALVSEYGYGRYCSVNSQLPIDSSQRYIADQITEYCTNGSNVCWVIEKDSLIQGLLGTRKSVWDTEIFGFNVGVLDYLISRNIDYKNELIVKNHLLEQCARWCQQENISFITARADTLDLSTIHALEQHSFQYIETTVINSYNVHNKSNLPNSDYRVRPICSNEIDKIVSLTKGAFPLHRFSADPLFSKLNADRVYEKWVSSCYKKDNCHIAVMDVDNNPAGFFLYSLKNLTEYFGLRFAMWQLAALSPRFRGKGLGHQLFLSTMGFLSDKADIIDSGLTMRNIVSLNLHNKLGFKTISSVVTFHKWVG